MKKIWIIGIGLAIIILFGLIDRLSFVTGVIGVVTGLISGLSFRKKNPPTAETK
jgi:hypothetical protein